MLTTSPRALPSPFRSLPAGPPPSLALLSWREAPEVSAPPAKRQGGFSMRGAKPKIQAPLSCESKSANLEPISCQRGRRGRGPSAEESKMDNVAKGWAWERDLVHVPPQRPLPEIQAC